MMLLQNLQINTNQNLSSPAHLPILASSILHSLKQLQKELAHCLWLIWHILQALLPQAYTQVRFPHADFVTSTTHKTLRGPRGGFVLSATKNMRKLDKAIMPGIQGGPLMHTIAAKAVAFHEALQPAFIDYQKQIVKNAQQLVRTFKELGYRIVADGTDNHLFILDLRSKNISGRAAEQALEKAGIAVSRSCIPSILKNHGLPAAFA